MSKSGIINPKLFYILLSAWAANDPLFFAGSLNAMKPEPELWFYNRSQGDVQINASKQIIYAQMPFYLNSKSIFYDFAWKEVVISCCFNNNSC